MVDSVVLIVDAVEGPMPQTRFVTDKAFAAGLNPIVVVNKCDRDGAAPHKAVDAVFDLFDNLGGNDEQMDFPTVFASAIQGIAGHEPDEMQDTMEPLFEMIVKSVPPPDVELEAPFQMQISSLDYSTYIGVLGIGRVRRGTLPANSPVIVVDAKGKQRRARVLTVLGHHGLNRVELPSAQAGNIVCVTGVENIGISDTCLLYTSPSPRDS